MQSIAIDTGLVWVKGPVSAREGNHNSANAVKPLETAKKRPFWGVAISTRSFDTGEEGFGWGGDQGGETVFADGMGRAALARILDTRVARLCTFVFW